MADRDDNHRSHKDRSIWGDQSRRHASLKTDGGSLIKVSHDFQPSSALSRIAGFHTFHAEVLVHKAMRGTAIGVALSSIELDQPWFVPAIVQKWQNSRQAELDKARAEQERRRKEMKQQIASGMAGLSREDRAAKEFAMKEAQLHADNVVLQAGQELREAQQAVLAVEAKLRDTFGPRVWFFTCEGCFYAGEKLVASTGVTFGDGDRVKIDLLGHELSVYVNDNKVPGITAAVCTRVFFAVCLQNKGAHVQIISSSHSEVEELRAAKGIEDSTEDEPDVTEALPPRSSSSQTRSSNEREDDILSSVAVLADVLMEKWAIVDQAFRALDANGDGMISHYEFKSVMSQFGITETVLARPVDDVWNYLDSDKSGKMSYSEFLERVSFARESSDGTGTWGRHHEDISVDGNVMSNNSCRGRAALMSKSATKGKHVVELKIRHMSGTLFIGAMQATRRVWIRAQKTVTEVTTLPLDHNWYYGTPPNDGAEKSASQVWYLSDVGTLRNGSKSVAHADVELKTGDTVLMELDMDKGELTFVVNGVPLNHAIPNVTGEVFPAVFIAGDAGDSVQLVSFSSQRPTA